MFGLNAETGRGLKIFIQLELNCSMISSACGNWKFVICFLICEMLVYLPVIVDVCNAYMQWYMWYVLWKVWRIYFCLLTGYIRLLVRNLLLYLSRQWNLITFSLTGRVSVLWSLSQISSVFIIISCEGIEIQKALLNLLDKEFFFKKLKTINDFEWEKILFPSLMISHVCMLTCPCVTFSAYMSVWEMHISCPFITSL